ncbi:MAG: hypothetical protein HOO96_32745 [Polyangiaceae bacterium]|nr:hypothetical protein [Polyangiaceae bacterium]
MQRLVAKYEEILRIRRAAPGETALEARPALRALALEFPGALRELDALPEGEIEARIAALQAVASGAPEAPWMRVLESYHRHFRGALGLKRALAAGSLEALDAGAVSWLPHRAAVHRPPGGRLKPLVIGRVAEELGMSASHVSAALNTRVLR